MFIILVLLVSGALCQYEPDCFCLEEMIAANGLVSPTDMRVPPDGSGRIMISEQIGNIFIIRPDGSRNPVPFLNFTEKVSVDHGESGLLAFVFHPDYANNRKLYVRYAYQDMRLLRLSEIQADVNNPDVVDYSTERVLIETYHVDVGHNGGGLLFAEDNYLYVMIGDGGYQEVGDVPDDAQNKTSFLGKVLRIDVDSRTGNLEYGIPPDNPFLNDTEATPELYALGLRNPWRASMDPGDRETGEGLGRIFISDVGHHTWEEIDLLQAGGNYGWAGREGPECYKPSLCGNTEPEVFPVTYYDRSGFGPSAVVGGAVYRGCMNPNYNGWYFYADFGYQTIFRLIEESPGMWDAKVIAPCSTCPENTTNSYPQYIQFFGVDSEGELYLGTQGEYDSTLPLGQVYKFVNPNNTQPICPAKREKLSTIRYKEGETIDHQL